MIFLVGTNNRNKEAFYSSTSIWCENFLKKKLVHRGCLYVHNNRVVVAFLQRKCEHNQRVSSSLFRIKLDVPCHFKLLFDTILCDKYVTYIHTHCINLPSSKVAVYALLKSGSFVFHLKKKKLVKSCRCNIRRKSILQLLSFDEYFQHV